MSSLSTAIHSHQSVARARNASARAIDWGILTGVGLAAGAAAVVANVLVYFLGDVVVGYNADFVELGSALGIAICTAIPAAIALLLFVGLTRFTSNPERNFTVVSAIVFVVTLIPDFTFIPGEPGASNGQTAILVLMHAVAATIITGLLTTYARPRAN